MTSKLEIKGKWKVPSSMEWINGTLIFDPDDEVRLEVFGTFSSHILDRSAIKIIIGDTTSGEVTLIENYHVNQRTQNGVFLSIYQPIFVIEGKHFENEKNISFRKVIFRALNLFEWLNYSGLQTDMNQYGRNYTIEYNQPAKIDFSLNEKCTGFLSFDSPINFTEQDNKIEIKEHCYVTLNYYNKNHYKNILKDIHFLTGFITLCTYGQSYPLRITFQDEDYLENVGDSSHLKFIYCHYQSTVYNKKHKIRKKYEHLVPFKVISESLPMVLNNWFNRYLEIEPVLNLLLYSFRDRNKFDSEKFMDIVRSLETFHRRIHKNYKLPKTEYSEKVKHILNTVDLSIEDKSWLKEKLNYGNEPTLNERLNELLTFYTNIYLQEEITDINSFCRSVVQSRNYYTHYDKSLEEKALHGEDLFLLYKKALALLISCVLEVIGVNKTLYEKNLRNVLA